MNNTTNHNNTPTASRADFMEWYRIATGQRLPIYVPTREKKLLVTKFEKQTGKKYTY
jgi:hypothetical protein